MGQTAITHVKYDIPFVPSSDEKVLTMMKLADIKIGEKAIDLGSGEGRLVMAMAAKGAQAVGVEIDPERSLLSITRIIAASLQNRARIIRGSFWRHNLSPYDIIVLYGVPSIMPRLAQKILNECQPSVRIVSNYFTFRDWRPQVSENHVHLYRPFAQ